MPQLIVTALVALMLTACQGGPSAGSEAEHGADQDAASVDVADVTLPPVSGQLDCQLGAAYELAGGLDVVVRDATAAPAAGAYNICYVNGFQTQPGEADLWLGDNEDLLLHDAAGNLVIDPEWPDEYVADPSTQAKRDRILDVLGPVVTGCAGAGFDAVEIDNLDTWTRFTAPGTGLIEQDDALALASAYIDLAHASGLAIGQKNAAEVTSTARGLGFDFAVTEECAAYGECAAYTGVYGEHVLQIEYTDNLPESFDVVCADPDRAPLTILRDRDLVGPDDAEHAYEQCA
ncbi:Glycoside-hydrolase family GH114 [Promicromonospora umidemergens]|uniref:Endo alpha-1,4 polygalactosaminidase n=1 Tax=Promicromonospora umidemergens TaxID=629679 RepID=A0ABP8WFF3_9MICO|nr:endo alpha-1,4 polygalactosaminidase [Promicromonospora umidemergens]MCP2285921.1 Glycoside-hydrolase family GH114 [Promicromonospora umidemergens]